MSKKSDIEKIFPSLLGGFKLKLKDGPWITLPDTPNVQLMRQYYLNPNCEFSFNVLQDDVELFQVKFGVDAELDRINKATTDIVNKAKGTL